MSPEHQRLYDRTTVTADWLNQFASQSYVVKRPCWYLSGNIWGLHIEQNGDSWELFYPLPDQLSGEAKGALFVRGYVTRQEVVKIWEVVNAKPFNVQHLMGKE